MVITVLYSLAGGMLVVIAGSRTEQIAWGFLRLVGMIVFAVVCGVTAWFVSRGRLEGTAAGVWAAGMGVALAVGAAVMVFIAPLAARMPRTFRSVCGVSGLLGLSAAALSAVARLDHEPAHPWAAAMVIASQVLSALLLGSVTVAWLLGHAYLTATKMTIAPLRHCSRCLSWSVAARAGFGMFSVMVAWIVGPDPAPSILSQLGQAWLVLILRVGVGLVAVGVFAYMVSDCVRLRATQSATGILYFGSLFAYIGELASQQLIAECGWPL